MAITLVNVYGQLVDLSGQPLRNAPVALQPMVSTGSALLDTDGHEVGADRVNATTGADGSFALSLLPSASLVPSGTRYRLYGPHGLVLSFTLPSTANYNPANDATTAKPAVFGVPATCLVSGQVADFAGVSYAAVSLFFGLAGWEDHVVTTASGGIVVPKPLAVTAGPFGEFVQPLLPAAALIPSGQTRAWIRGPSGLYAGFTVPSTTGTQLTSLL